MGKPEVGITLVVSGGQQATSIVNNFNTSIKTLNVTAKGAAGPMSALSASLSKVGRSVTSAGKSLTLGLTVPIVGLGLAALKTGVEFETAFAGVSKTVEGVSTITDGVFDGFTESGERLRETILAMSREMPVTASELANLGEIAGQFGAKLGDGGAASEVAQMIEVLAKLRETTNIVSETAQQKFAQIASVAGLTADQFGNLASAVVFLGNNFPTTETQIVNFTNRLIGTAGALGISTDQVLGWGAAVTASGIRAETGATAIRKAFQEMTLAVITSTDGIVDNTQAIADAEAELTELSGTLDEAVAKQTALGDAMTPEAAEALKAEIANLTSEYENQTGVLDALAAMHGKVFEGGSEQLKLFASVATDGLGVVREQFAASGMSAQEFADSIGISVGVLDSLTLSGSDFATLFETDANAAMQLFLNGLSTLEGTEATAVLDALGLGAQRVGATLQNVASDIDGLNSAMGGAAAAFENQDALNDEFIKRTATLESMIGVLKNQFMALGIAIFDLVQGDLKIVVNEFGILAGKLADLPEPTKKTILAILAFAAAIGPIVLVVGAFITAIGGILGVISAISAPMIIAALAIGALIAVVVSNIGADNVFDFIKNIVEDIPGAIEIAKIKIAELIETISNFEINEIRIGDIISGEADLIDLIPEGVITAAETLVGHIQTIVGLISGDVALRDILPETTVANIETITDDISTIIGLISGEVSLRDILPEETVATIESAALGIQTIFDLLAGEATLSDILPEETVASIDTVVTGIQDIADALSGIELPEFGSLEGLLSTIEGITGAVDLLKEGFDGAFEQVSAIFLDSIGESLTGLSTSFDLVKTAVENATGPFESMKAAIGETAPWLTLSNVIKVVATILGAVFIAVISVIIVVLSIVIRVITAIIVNVSGFIAFFATLIAGIFSLIGPVIQLIIGAFQLIVAAIQGDTLAVNEAMGKMREAFEKIKTRGGELLNDLLTIVSDTLTSIAALFLNEEALAKFSEFIDGIIAFANDLFMELVGGSIFPDMVNGIIAVLGDLLTEGLALFGDLVNGMIDLAEGIGETVGKIFSGLFDGAGGDGGGDAALIDVDAINSAKTAAGDVATALSELGVATVTMLSEFSSATTEMGTLLSAFGKLADTTWQTIIISFSLMTTTMQQEWMLLTQFIAQDMMTVTELLSSSMSVLLSAFTSTIASMSAAWSTFVAVFSAGAAAISAALIEVSATAAMLESAIGAAMSSATSKIRVLIGAFHALAAAAQISAAAVVTALAAIANAAAAAQSDVTGSPELKLQHPFERFVNFMDDDFAPKVPKQITAALAPIVGLGTEASVSANSVVSTTSNVDNSVDVNVTGSSNPIESAIDILRDRQQVG